ncbi:transcriptional regulator [Rivularia sp. PCC 7116]|uniref:LysR family transcriptional regulator n=1 Tax=Rivularia sp. PCC 7116 TaxID=373994 RepID=UPI00029F3EA9|nr:LysR family transcriptional regulator [Rivularia sp. PCC 7116]AFY58479.1 transcriptional regulator [Rivularia sp. PCC 7116]
MTSIPPPSSVNIDYTNLRKLDLNLLVALDVLIEEASVTKAAEKLNISQSSMSHALKRLRTVLDDEILIRTSRDMEVTPLAREISYRVHQILAEIQSTLLEKETFEPATAREDFRIAASDYIETTLGVSLLQQLTSQAPNIRVRICNLNKEKSLDALDNNQIDLVIDANLPLKRWHIREDLYHEEFVCVVKSDCPLTELSVEEYVSRSQILVSMRDDFQGSADKILEQQQLQRQVIWSTPHFMPIPFLIANSDCVTLLPNRVAQNCAKTLGLKLLQPPIEVEGFTVSMVWHQRNTNRLSHQWLRTQLLEAARDI